MVRPSKDPTPSPSPVPAGKGPFEEELERQRREAQGAATGSSSKTPWSTGSWKPGAAAGVSVPKTWDQIYADTSTLQGVTRASDPQSYTWRESRQPSDVPNYYALNSNERDLFNAAAKSIHPLKTGEAFYGELIQASYDLSLSGIYKSPQQLAYDAYTGGGGEADGGGGRGGAYSGPVSSVSKWAESDIKNLANTVAMQMVGRGVSDEELRKITRRMQTAEVEQPSVSSGGQATTTTQQGLTQIGREDIVKNIIAKQPEYGEFQKATTLMSWFDQALSGRVQ